MGNARDLPARDAAPATEHAVKPSTLLPSVARSIERLHDASGWVPVEEGTRAAYEERLGFDFSRVRIHAGDQAGELAGMLGARAFTAGSDVVFGKGQYSPRTPAGSALLEHELAHVVQQSRGSERVIQRATVYDFVDADPLHDPSRLSDKQIESTSEFTYYMSLNPKGKPATVSPEDARLALRLMLRFIRLNPKWSGPHDLMAWLKEARLKSAVAAGTEKSVGHLDWVPVQVGEYTAPATAQSEFTKWMLAAGKQPDPHTGKLNCWEMVLFSAFQAGQVSEKRLREIYTKAQAGVKAGGPGTRGSPFIRQELFPGTEQVFDPTNANTPRPLRGDIIVFNTMGTHTALATGKLVGGKNEIISHWPPPDGSHATKRTTIEDLLASPEMQAQGAVSVLFWSPKW